VHCRQLHLHVMNAYNKDSMVDETARRFSESSVTDTIITIRRTHRDTRENGSDKKNLGKGVGGLDTYLSGNDAYAVTGRYHMSRAGLPAARSEISGPNF